MILHIKPAPGRRVRQPDGAWLPDEGLPLGLTSYWRRRRDDGDIVIGEPAKPKSTRKTQRGER
ncbi:hypothetical protein D9M68_590570 [compost metagenome]